MKLEVGVEVMQFLFLVDLAWRPSLVWGLRRHGLDVASYIPLLGALGPGDR